MAETQITQKKIIKPTNTPGKSPEYRQLEALFLHYKELNPKKYEQKKQEFKSKLEAIDLGVKWSPKMRQLGAKEYLKSLSGVPTVVVDKAEIQEPKKDKKPKIKKAKK